MDILTGPERILKSIGVKAKDRRAYPKPKINLHARTVDEALTLEEYLQAVAIETSRSSRETESSVVFLPHSFTFIIMKLFALRDRINDSEKDFGRHHALDLYTIIAMLTEEEWNVCLELSRKYSTDAIILEAGELARKLFEDQLSLGALRLKESNYYRPDFQVREFLEALRDLFVRSD